MKRILTSFWETGRIAIFALLFAFAIRAFVFQPFLVRGASMEPNFHHGDYLIVDELSYRFKNPERGEVIVFRYPNDPSQRYIKRVIGLPGETVIVEDGRVMISDESGGSLVLQEEQYLSRKETIGQIRIKLGNDEYFVLGDNRAFSSDSRVWGALGRTNIVGRVVVRMFPDLAYGKEI